VFQQVSEDLQHTYMLAYKPPPNTDQSWRAIELSVPGLRVGKVLAKSGYFPK